MNREAFILPASFAQRRLWFLEQLTPGDPSYTLLSRISFCSQIDDGVLELCIQEIVQRHEILRTTFALDSHGEPVQIVHAKMPLSLKQIDVRYLSLEQGENEIARIAIATLSQSFDLERGPLFHVVLVRLGHDGYALLLAIHHIIADGWSLGVLFRELVELYPALSAGRPSPLPPLPIQYCDYAVWQRDLLKGEKLEQLLAYWRNQLQGLPDIALPTDRLSSESHTTNACCPLHLSKAQVTALETLGQQEGCTLFMVMLSTFFVLLRRHTGQEDFAIGTPIAGRTRIEVEGLIGFFVNTLVLRADLRGDPTFQQLLDRVRKTTLDAYTHQECPFELVVEELGPERRLLRNPLVQVMFHLQNAPNPAASHPVNTQPGGALPAGSSAFDLAIDLWRDGDRLSGHCEYNPDLFHAATIDRLLTRFQLLLDAVPENLQCPISRLPMVPEAEAVQLNHWGSPSKIPASNRCVLEWMIEQASAIPNAIALAAENQELSYRQLYRCAERLAQRLRSLGVCREQTVGLCLPRSVSYGVALLGILMAGAAFVCLDPTYPSTHLASLLRTAKTRFVIAAGSCCSLTAALEEIPVEERPTLLRFDHLDKQDGLIDEPPAGENTAQASDLAYVVFTSGTTGPPKGIEIEHRALASRIAAVQPRYRLQATDRVLHFASFGFDAAIEELLAPWKAGATVVMRPDESFSTFAEFHRFIEKYHLTVLNLPTAYWHAWVSELERSHQSVPECVSLVIVGSEAALPERLRTWQHLAPTVRWINAYGPAEATITAILDEPQVLQPVDESVSIGTPLVGTEAWVLDEQGELTPIGVPGELYLGGEGLARGYLNDPDQTTAAFLLGSGMLGQRRFYRTGDWVQWRPDGRLVFLGRMDEQVKIRGIRLELGAIEAVLHQHPSVKAAALKTHEMSPGDRRLIAYVVLRDNTSMDELHQFLNQRLPPAMVPSRFLSLPQIPVTPNGKVDRRSLPPPPDPTETAIRTSPQNLTEQELAHLWQEVLRAPVPDIHDDFFRSGGHSLLATQFLSRIRDSLGVEISLREFFVQPTIAGLAERVEQARQVMVLNDCPDIGDPAFLSRLDYLSEEQIDTLLADLMDVEEVQ